MTRRPRRLVLVGSVIADVLMAVPRLPERGGDLLAPAVTQAGGGFNVLAAARRLGMPAALAGHVGEGPFGHLVADALAAADVERLLPPAPGDTGFCLALVEPDAERTFVTSPGVESRLTADDLAAVPLGVDDAVYLSGYDLCYPTTGPAVAAWCADLGDVLLTLDPGPLVAEIPRDVLCPLLDRTDVLTLNAREVRLLAGTADLGDASRAVRRRLGPSALLIVRDGARGCTLHLPGDVAPAHVPAPPVTAVDTTGAGDAHTGAFLAGLHRTGSVTAAALHANAAAALSVTRAGSATSPGRDELDRLLQTWHQTGHRDGNPRGSRAE
jgi:sugar/nucleoside kinase (ribokinase family)